MRVSIEISDAPDAAAELRTTERAAAPSEAGAYHGGPDQMTEQPPGAEPGETGAEGRGPGGPPLPAGAEGRGPGGPPIPVDAEVHNGGGAPILRESAGAEARPPSPPRQPPLQIEEPYGNGHRG